MRFMRPLRFEDFRSCEKIKDERMCTVDARLWILTVVDPTERENNAAKRSRCEF